VVEFRGACWYRIGENASTSVVEIATETVQTSMGTTSIAVKPERQGTEIEQALESDIRFVLWTVSHHRRMLFRFLNRLTLNLKECPTNESHRVLDDQSLQYWGLLAHH
jgi:hypothetical protein